ncbi:glycosyltransferase family 2 protein [Labrys neptuniae]
MSLILFSTTDLAGPRRQEFARMLASIERNCHGGPAIRLYVLLQNATPERLDALQVQVPSCCRMTAIPGRCSISAARNQLIARALEDEAIGADDVVGFPDDDCWYPDGVAAGLADSFAALADLDVLICRVALQPDGAPPRDGEVRPARVRDIVRVTTSNSMFLRGSVFLRLGDFDPELGVGTPNGGAEDTDYAIRALLVAGQAGLIDRALIAHPVPDQDSAAKYYRSALIVLARHAGRRPALMMEFLRKIAVGGYFLARRKLSARGLFAALMAAAGSFAMPARTRANPES